MHIIIMYTQNYAVPCNDIIACLIRDQYKHNWTNNHIMGTVEEGPINQVGVVLAATIKMGVMFFYNEPTKRVIFKLYLDLNMKAEVS